MEPTVSAAGELREQIARIERERRRYRQLFMMGGEPRAVTDGSGVVLEANAAFGEVLGVEPRWLFGLPLEMCVTGAERPAFRSWLGSLAEGWGPPSREVRCQVVDGCREFRVLLRASPMEDDIAWGLVQLGDHERVEALEQEARRKDEFLAMIGHELRNPLAPLMAAAQLLRVAADGGDFNRQRKAVEIISRQVNHLNRLIEDLLDVARLNEGKLGVSVSPMRLGDVIDCSIQPAVEAIQSRLQAREQTLYVELPPRDDIMVEVDPVRLQQVVANLLDNAAKYSPARKRIWLSVSRDEMRVAVSVRDEGIGIPADKLSRIFALFDQADRPHEACGGGLGIGLALVERLVELQGGQIHVYSDGAGRGSEFVIHLPIRAAA